MKRLIYALPGNDDFADLIALRSRCQRKGVQVHGFPDGESRVTVEEPPANADIVVVCTLDHPDAKLVPLLMVADTLRGYRPRRIVLVAPYLPYMRQDARFHPGEAVSATLFGTWLATHFDAIVTVDPHLHRLATLAQVGMTSGLVAHAAPAIAAWIQRQAQRVLVIGPDEESRAWVSDVASRLHAPCVVAHKVRDDDTHVRIALPPEAGELLHDRTPVFIDDIAASGRTMSECIQEVTRLGAEAPICVAIHGVLAPGAREAIVQAGAACFVTTNTIDNPDARIDVTGSVVQGLESLTLQALPGTPSEGHVESGRVSPASANRQGTGRT